MWTVQVGSEQSTDIELPSATEQQVCAGGESTEHGKLLSVLAVPKTTYVDRSGYSYFGNCDL